METTSSNLPWSRTPGNLRLEPGVVDVWRSRVDLPAMQRLALQQCLSPLEMERANRYRVHERREEFIVARGLLRTILARLLGADPRHLEFTFSGKGKPSLVTPETGRGVAFNVSHSYGMILVAATTGAAVGVDVERVREQTEFERLAERFFSPGECAALMRVPEEERRRAFFLCWTRKEAFLKATGMGITTALDSFDVGFWPAEDARLLATRWDADEAARWTMKNLIPSAEHAGSLAVEGTARLRQWEVW